MNRIPLPNPRLIAVGFGALAMLGATAIGLAETGRQVAIPVEAGLVTFDVATNISAVSVHGKSGSVRGLVRARVGDGQLFLEEVLAALPVDALTTGMSLRDEHMKKYIFTTSDHQTPELRFKGQKLACPMNSNSGAVCQATGNMTIRGVEKPLTLSLKVKVAGSAYRAVGDGSIKLSDYGIERPSQFGVRCADDVRIHIEISGRESVESAAPRTGGAN